MSIEHHAEAVRERERRLAGDTQEADLDSVDLLCMKFTDWFVVSVDLHHSMGQHLHQPIYIQHVHSGREW